MELECKQGKNRIYRIPHSRQRSSRQKGETLKGMETNVALGSRLCTTANIRYMCNRGNHAFHQ